MPDWSYRVNYEARRKVVTSGQFGIPACAATKAPTSLDKLPASSPQNSAGNTTIAEQRWVGGVDDGIDRECRDIGLNGMQFGGHIIEFSHGEAVHWPRSGRQP